MRARPWSNSVTYEDERLETVLPLVKKHGAAVVGVANDDTGISNDPRERLRIARLIVERAADHGIPAEDVLIDPLALTVSADDNAALITLETIRLIREELGVNMTCGASNISFGLPCAPERKRRLSFHGYRRRVDLGHHQSRSNLKFGA